jgi:hypothetical protein
MYYFYYCSDEPLPVAVWYTSFSAGFYSTYRTLAFLNGLLDPQTIGRTPWLGDQSNARPLPKHRTTQYRNTQTHIHAPSRIPTWDLNVQSVVDNTCLRLLGYWDRPCDTLMTKITFGLYITLTVTVCSPSLQHEGQIWRHIFCTLFYSQVIPVNTYGHTHIKLLK